MPIPNRYYEAVRGWSPQRARRHRRRATSFDPITDKVRAGRSARRLHRRRRPRALHGPHLSARVLEPHRVRHRTDRPPRRPRSCSRRNGADFSSQEQLEPPRQRRRMDRPDHGRGRPRRQRLGHRLVQLHRAAQSDAGGLSRTGKGNAYETNLRDKKHGRIYRVVVKDEGRRMKDEGETSESEILNLNLKSRSVRRTPLPRSNRSRARSRSSLSPPCAATTCSGGCMNQRLLMEDFQPNVHAALVEMIADQSVPQDRAQCGCHACRMDDART